MEHDYKRDEYYKKYTEWKEKQSNQIRFHHYEDAFDHIHKDGFLIFSGKFQSFEFYFLFISGLVLLSAFILLGVFGHEELIGIPSNIIILVTGLICSSVFVIMALWYAFTVPKFALVLGPEGFLYKRQGIFRFFYWNEIEDMRSFDRRVSKRPRLKKKTMIIKTEEFPKPVINVAKLPYLTLYLYYSYEFHLQETGKDLKAVEMQEIIVKLMMEYWNSRKN